MKQLYTMLLALGMSATCAMSQNVTVFMKDNTTHKYPAEYLSEISFRDVTPGPEAVEFKQIDLNVFSGGNVTVTLTNEAGDVECVTDLYGSTTASWLEAGVYTVDSGTMSPFTVDPAYSYVTTGGERHKITAGTVTVAYGPEQTSSIFREASADHEYRINVDLTLDNGQTLKGAYKGELPTYTPWIEAVLTGASYNVNPQPAGQFYVKFNDADWRYEMAMIFVADPAAKTLPSGTYTLSDFATPGSLLSASYVDGYRPNFNAKLLEGSVVTVTETEGRYDITMNLKLDDGREATFTFKGEISGTPEFEVPDPDVLVFPKFDMEVYGYGNVTLRFFTEDNSQNISLDCYQSSQATFLQTGVYTIGALAVPYIDKNVNYTFYCTADGNDTPVTTGFESGTLTVTREEAVYTFLLDAVLTDGTPIKMTCTTELPTFGPVINLTMSAAEYRPLENPEKGNVYVKFHDADYSAEMALDIWYFPFAGNEIYPTDGDDVLTFQQEGGYGLHFSGQSYLDTFRPTTNNRFKEGSTVKILESENGFKFIMHLLLEDGRTAEVTYDGPVTGDPVAKETVNVTCPDVKVDVYSMGSNITLTFTSADKDTEIALDTYYYPTPAFFQTGVYKIEPNYGGYTDGAYIDDSIYYTYYNVNGTKIGLESGTLTVTRDGAVYTFVLVADLADGRRLKMNSTTELPKFGPVINLTMSAATYFPLENPEKGNVYVKFHDADYNCEMALDIWYFPFAQNEIYPTDGDDILTFQQDAGYGLHFSGKSYLDTFNPTTNNRFLEGSTVKILESENGFKFTMHLLLQDGRIAEVTYDGPVTGNPVAQTPIIFEPSKLEMQIWSNGANVGLFFYTEDGKKVSLDTYNRQGLSYFEPGVYTIGSDEVPRIAVDQSWTYYNDGTNGNVALTSGTLTVTLDGDLYTFVLDAELADGNRLKLNYTGELPKFGPTVKLTMTSAQYFPLENPEKGNVYVKFRDANTNAEMALDIWYFPFAQNEIYPTDGDDILTFQQEGGYGLHFSGLSYLDMFDPTTNNRFKEGSTVKILESDNGFKFTMHLLLQDGRTAEITYDGPVTGDPIAGAPTIFEPSKLEMQIWSNGANVGLYFYTEDGKKVSLDTYNRTGVTYFEPGVYTIGSDAVPYISTSPSWTYYEDGTNGKIAMTSGTLTVTLDGDLYTFVLDAVLADGNRLKLNYTGELPEFGPTVKLTMTSAEYFPLENPAKGNVYVKFRDTTTNAEMALDIWYYPFTGNQLYATDGDDILKFEQDPGTPLTFSGTSYLDLFNPTTNNRFKEGSTVKILDSGNGFKFIMHLLLQDGRIAEITYDGPVTGNPVAN